MIWILDQTVLPVRPEYTDRFTSRDEPGRTLVERGSICLFERREFPVETVANDAERWRRFFMKGEQLDTDHVPDGMWSPVSHTPALRQERGRSLHPEVPVNARLWHPADVGGAAHRRRRYPVAGFLPQLDFWRDGFFEARLPESMVGLERG